MDYQHVYPPSLMFGTSLGFASFMMIGIPWAIDSDLLHSTSTFTTVSAGARALLPTVVGYILGSAIPSASTRLRRYLEDKL